MTRRRAIAVVRLVVAAAVAVALVWGIARNWTEISQDLQRVSLGALALCFVPAALGTWLTMLGWRVVLADLGSPLHVAPAAGVWFVGQLGKYLPGSVWTVLMQADMAAHLDVPRRRTGVASLVTIGLSVLTGLLVGAPSIPLLLQRPNSSALGWVLLGIPLLAVLCWPPVLDRIVGLGLRVLRQQPLEKALSGRAVLIAVVVFCVAWLCFGLHVLVLANAVGAAPSRAMVVGSLTGFALSGALSMVTVILPAGLGAREGLLTLILASSMPGSAGAAVAIVSRFVVTVVDVLAAAGGWAYARRHHLVASREDREEREEREAGAGPAVADEP